MGVPVVTLRGRTALGRGGASILSNVGLNELIAEDARQYVEVAKSLADDIERLVKMRAGLRERIQGSVLMDGKRFARNMEDAMRRMWREYCTGADD
jgi:predicted O-linked N-acetylglucosamine transferase (SPINDLY family)